MSSRSTHAHLEKRDQPADPSIVPLFFYVRLPTSWGQVPCEDCGVYVTERTPPELLRDLDREVLRSAFRAAGYALASVAIAGFLLSYIYVVCSDLREALQRKKKKKGDSGEVK